MFSKLGTLNGEPLIVAVILACFDSSLMFLEGTILAFCVLLLFDLFDSILIGRNVESETGAGSEFVDGYSVNGFVKLIIC